MGKFLDAALNGAASYAGKAYFFKGAKYVRYDWNTEQGDPGYPLGVDNWGFPSPFDKGIDAAVEGREGYAKKAFFFKDDKYLSYDWAADKVDSGYPKNIDAWELPAAFFSGGKKKIDAVVNGVGDEARYCYFFNGTIWVRLDWKEQEKPELHKGPVQTDWDLPGEFAKGIDAALTGWGKKYGSKVYFFKEDKYARFDWSADKCDFKNGSLGAWKTSWDDAAPAKQQGPATQQGTTDAPPGVFTQPWNGQNGKVWVPSGASGKLPLVVYLHGQIHDGDPFGAGMMLADDATFKRGPTWATNVGNLAGHLIAKNKIKPVAVAAPSDRVKDLKGMSLWSTFDLGAFVDEVVKKVQGDYGADIDLDQVALVGHSGAGCWSKCGLDKVARQGGKFNGHTVTLLGFADTWVDGAYSKGIKDGLGSAATSVYAIYKGTGGHQYKNGGDKDYATGFGANHDLKGQPLPGSAEEQDAFDLYWDDGDVQSPPKHTVARVNLGSKSVAASWKSIVNDAKAGKDALGAHPRMPLVWSWYGLQRYFGK